MAGNWFSSHAKQQALRAVAQITAPIEAERDRAYRERAHLVAHFASLYPSHIGHADPDAPDWAVVTIETPTGQMSWHVAPADMDLFRHIQASDYNWRPWDGHTTDEKYERLQRLAATGGRPVHPDGTPYQCHEITDEGWEHCDCCGHWSKDWTPETPHQCPVPIRAARG